MFKKLKNNLFAEDYKNDKLHALEKQYQKKNGNHFWTRLSIGLCFAIAYVFLPAFSIAQAAIAIGGSLITGNVGAKIDEFGFKGGFKIMGELCKNTLRALKTTLKGVDETITLRKNPAFDFCKGLDEASLESTPLKTCLRDLFKIKTEQPDSSLMDHFEKMTADRKIKAKYTEEGVPVVMPFGYKFSQEQRLAKLA